MNKKTISNPPKPQEAHRRQVWMQIVLPFGLGVLFVLAVAVLTVTASLPDRATIIPYANLTLILIISLNCLTSLIFLVLVAGSAFAVFKINQVLPETAQKIQLLAEQISLILQVQADKTVAPVIKVHSWYAQWGPLKKKIFPAKNAKQGHPSEDENHEYAEK